MNHRNGKMTKKSVICWLLAVVMMLTSISVSAAEETGSGTGSFGGETGIEKFDVTFLATDGTGSSAFESRNMTVVSGSKVKLPSVPAVTGYTGLGWSTRKNAATAPYKPGGYLTITRNITLYAVMKNVGTFKVAFNNNSGTSKSDVYKALNKKVTKNQYLTLPAVPKASGYVNLGWTTTKKAKKPLYKAGTKVRITKNTKFYAVRRKIKTCTVTFYLGDGSSNKSYKALKKTVKEGTKVTLPSIPKRKGYVNLGWTTKKNGKTVTKRVGVTGRVRKNLKFYAVQKQAVTVTLYKSNGRAWKKISMGKGDSLKLPGVKTQAPYTMMGWSTKKGQRTNPTYEVGMTLRKINSPLKLYAVVYNRSAEKNYKASEIAQPDLRKYKEVIFVGDSRTQRMGQTVKSVGAVTRGVTFITHEDAGLSWLQNEGYKSLMNIVGNQTSSALAKKTAVIFNLGINDLSNANNYVKYMKSLGAELEKKGCALFYMSVNPVNNEMMKAAGMVSTPEETVRSFNSAIQRGLCSGTTGKYRYLNIYSYLLKNGYSTDAGAHGKDSGVDDGLHYTTKTYKRIYNQALSMI